MYRIGREEIEAVSKVIESKNLFKVNDACRETERCEEEFRRKFGVNYALMMTSGKAALISALTALGIGPGDEVIVPAYTYIATAMAVTAVGAIPVLAEVDETLTIDPEDIEKKISQYTKAVIPVHIQGFPCNMDAICGIAKKYNLKIVEDACQADGGSYHGKRLGTIGDVGALSFNQFKIISAGEGGCLLTDEKRLFERALIYHDSSAIAFFGDQLSGVEEKAFCGVEYRTNEITSAIMRVQLARLDGLLEDLRRQKKYIMEKLKEMFEFAPSNDVGGDCGVTVAFSFPDSGSAEEFANAVEGCRPIDTGKHVYTHWTPILNHAGAYNKNFNPFLMEANKNLNMEYTRDMCPKTLDILSRTVYLGVNPDWSKSDADAVVKKCIAAKK